MIGAEGETFESAAMLGDRGKNIFRSEGPTREGQVDQRPVRSVAMDPPEPFGDFAQLRLLPLVQAFRNFAMSSPRFRAS